MSPDAAGNVIPAGITEGSAELAGSLGEQQEILVSLDASVYNVRKATCGEICWTCNGVVDWAVSLSPFAVATGGTTTEILYETNNSGYQNIATASWKSSATGIATVNSSGVVTGVSLGSLTLTALDLYQETVGGWYCTYVSEVCPTESVGGSAPGTAQVPTSLKVLSINILPTGTSGDYGCTPGYDYGIAVDIKYQVLDQRVPPQPILNPAMVPHEHIVWSDGGVSDNNVGPSRISTTSATTAADGTFHDAPVSFCSALPSTAGSNTQTLTIILSGHTYTVRSQQMNFSAITLPGHGSLKNNLGDINASR